MPSAHTVAAQLPGGSKKKQLEPQKSVAGKKSQVGGGAPIDQTKASSTTKNTEKKKTVRSGLTPMERQLIAKLKSKTETKLGDSRFAVGTAGKRADLSNLASKPLYVPKPAQTVTVPTRQPQAPDQQTSPSTQFQSQQEPAQIPPHHQQPKTPSRPQLPLQRKSSSVSLPQQPKTKNARPQLPTAKSAKHAVEEGIKSSLSRKPPPPVHNPSQQKRPALPTKTQKALTHNLQKRKKSPSPPPPPQQKSKTASSSSQPKSQKLSILPSKPKPKFQLPTQQQKSLAERRRRDARRETPITLNEVDMNEKEIDESKSLLMCFLSGMDRDPMDGKTAKKNGKGGYNDATSTSSLYVDNFQHDPSNRATPYHYSAPPSQKRAKAATESVEKS